MINNNDYDKEVKTKLLKQIDPIDFSVWKTTIRYYTKEIVKKLDHKCEFKILDLYSYHEKYCLICKGKYTNNKDSEENKSQIKTSHFWKENNKYRNQDKSISLLNCIKCEIIICQVCLNIGFNFALNFTKFKNLLNDNTLFVACGGCNLDKWKEEAMKRTQNWFERLDHKCNWGDGIKWEYAADLVRCDICSYNYIGPFDYITSYYHNCVSGYWGGNAKYKFGKSECYIFICNICNVVICNACREVGYDYAAKMLKNQLILTNENFSKNVNRIILLYFGLKLHKNVNFKKLAKKNIFILVRNFLAKYPNKELSGFLEI